jgi:hypothetical protein
MPDQYFERRFKKSVSLAFSAGSCLKITYSTIWLIDVSTYACYEDIKK